MTSGDGQMQPFSELETGQWIKDWLKAFGKDKQGANTKAFMWHLFSGGRYPCVSGSEAINQYEQQIAPVYIVLSNDRKQAFASQSRPGPRVFSDYYVFPPNLAWTMAFTHEDGWLGPYFALHENFARLNDENIARIKKIRQMEEAKIRGWH